MQSLRGLSASLLDVRFGEMKVKQREESCWTVCTIHKY